MLFQNSFAEGAESVPQQELEDLYISCSSEESLESPRNTLPSTFHKPSPPPVRMYKDPEKLREEHMELSRAQGHLKAINAQLQAENSKKQTLCTEIQQAILKISQVLPQNCAKEELPETKLFLEAERKVKGEVWGLKRAPETTRSLLQLAYFEELREHRDRLQEHQRRTQAENARLLRERDFSRREEEEFRKALPKLRRQAAHTRLGRECQLNADKVLENEVATKLTKKQIGAVQDRTKELQGELQALRFTNEGLEYECSTILKHRFEIPGLQRRTAETQAAIAEKQERIQLLRRTFEDKSRTLQYMRKWTEELKERLDEKRLKEAQAKEKLETKINVLNKEFDEWNSKYKLLLMEDQTAKTSKRRELNVAEKQAHANCRRVRLVKHYEIQRLCRRIGFELTLRGIPAEQFARLVVEADAALSVETILERLKAIEWLGGEPDLFKLARYATEDNQQSRLQPPPPAATFDSRVVALVLVNMLGPVLLHADFQRHLEAVEHTLRRHCDDIRHEISGLNKVEFFDEERLREGLSFLEVKATPEQIKAACIRMYSLGDEIDRYSMLTFRKAFGSLRTQHSLLPPEDEDPAEAQGEPHNKMALTC